MRRRESEKRQGGEKGQLVTASGPTGINVRDETDREREREREMANELTVREGGKWEAVERKIMQRAELQITRYRGTRSLPVVEEELCSFR